MVIYNFRNIFAFIVLPMIGNFFLTYLIFYFMSRVERNIYRKKQYYFLVYLLYSIALSGIALLGNGFLNFVGMLIGILLIGHFTYNDSKNYKIYYLLYILCFFLCDTVVSLSIGIVISASNLRINDIASFQMLTVVLIRLAEFVYTKLALLFMNRRTINNLKIKQVITFMIIPLFSIFYMFTLFNYVQIYPSIDDVTLFVVNICLIFILNIYVTYLFDNISKNNTLQNEINLYQQQSKLQYKYYDNLEKKYQESRKFAHDIRNHLNTIEDLYKINDIQSAKEYTNDIHSMLNELNQKYYTSNKVLNIILNDKFNISKDKDIKIDCRIGDVKLDFIREIDITTIFANLIDNAIEAASQANKDKYIKLDIDKFNELLVINISNSMKNKPIQKGNKFKSTKENHSGLGIENIKKALKAYDGTILIDYTDDEFKVNIVISI